MPTKIAVIIKEDQRVRNDAKQWLSAHLTMHRLELLREKRQLEEARGADTTRFVDSIAHINRDLAYVALLLELPQ